MIKGEVRLATQAFVAGVAWAAKFVAQRPAVPVQGGMRLTAEDGRLTLEAFREGVQAKAAVAYEGDGAGSVIVSGRLLAELAKTFRGNAVVLTDDDGDLAVTAGRWAGTLPGMADDWPGAALVAPETIGTIGGTAFAALIEQAGVATTDDEKKPVPFHCMHLTFGEYAVTAIATDGYRAVRAYAPFALTEEASADETAGLSAILLGHIAVDAAAAFIGPDTITVGLGPHALSLASPTREIVLGQMVLDGGYKGAELIEGLAAVDHPRVATVQAAALLTPMKAANIMRGDREGPILVTVAEGKILVHAKSTQVKQRGDEDVDAEYSGPSHTMALNPKYFADALGSAPGETVAIAFNEAEQRPGRPWHAALSVPGNDAWRHVLMPIKIQGA